VLLTYLMLTHNYHSPAIVSPPHDPFRNIGWRFHFIWFAVLTALLHAWNGACQFCM